MDKHFYESINEGKPTCIDDDIPFDIPDSWEWVKLSSIADVKGGKRIPAGMQTTTEKTAHVYIRVADMVNGTISDRNLVYITEEVFQKISRYTISKNDLYLTIAGTIGKAGVVPELLDGMNLTENAVKITNISVNKDFLLQLLQSDFCQSQFVDKTTCVAQPKLAIERILSVMLPIPPPNEQNRILDSVSNRFKKLNAIIDSRRKYKRILSETPTSLRQQLIQAAIQGRLVSQNPDDEPASVLLKRIAQERTVKLGKKAAKSMSRIERRGSKTYIEISPDGKEKDISEEIPFDIPQNWEWCRLEQIGDAYIGLTYCPSDVREKGTAVLRANNIQSGKICYDEVLHVETDIPERAYINKGDLLICARNGSKNLVGKTAIVERNGDAYGAFMAKFVSVSSQYLYYFFSSQFFREQLDDANTTTIYQVTQAMLKRLLCPLPPAAEQVCICDRLGLLLKTLDS